MPTEDGSELSITACFILLLKLLLLLARLTVGASEQAIHFCFSHTYNLLRWAELALEPHGPGVEIFITLTPENTQHAAVRPLPHLDNDHPNFAGATDATQTTTPLTNHINNEDIGNVQQDGHHDAVYSDHNNGEANNVRTDNGTFGEATYAPDAVMDDADEHTQFNNAHMGIHNCPSVIYPTALSTDTCTLSTN